ncbi:MAG TPA: hypothetical protein VIK72_01780, partial [Clostridiaceae bacterium]
TCLSNKNYIKLLYSCSKAAILIVTYDAGMSLFILESISYKDTEKIFFIIIMYIFYLYMQYKN